MRTTSGVVLGVLFSAFLGSSALAGGAAPSPVDAERSPAPVSAMATAVACPDCNDNNPCTVDACDARFGTCRHDPLDCDDGNPCTLDSCSAIDGCRHAPLTGACDDGNPCVYQSQCQQGACVPTEYWGEGTACDDGNPCTTDDSCDAGHVCRGLALAAGSPCDDHDACTTNETCSLDATGSLVCHGTGSGCDDQDPCTTDSCNPVTGACVHAPVVCDDGNPCTADACDRLAGGCVPTPIDGGACAGPDFCTAYRCSGGNCTEPDPTRRACDFGPCVTYQCVEAPTPHCQFVRSNDGAVCGSGGACYSQVCMQGFCQTLPLTGSCDTGSPCVLGQCVRGGCQGVFGTTGNPCDDGVACTVNDTCQSGQCIGTATSCDDANPCTADRCDSQLGCVHSPIQPGPITCGLGACARTVDACAGGVPQECVPGTPTAEVCNGVDDDCNGVIDDNRVQATCLLRPATLRNPPLLSMLGLECTFRNRCSGNLLIPPAGVPISATWISRADRLLDMSDNVAYPDPATLACPDPVRGTAFERGVAEDVEARTVQATTVTFRFDRPGDGDCTTLDGDKSAVLDLLPPGTPNSLLLVCLSGALQGFPFEGCGIGLLLNQAAP